MENSKIKSCMHIILIEEWLTELFSSTIFKYFKVNHRHHYISTINTSAWISQQIRTPLHNHEMMIRHDQRSNNSLSISNIQSIFIFSQSSPISLTVGWIDNYLFKGMLLVAMALKALLK